MNSSFISDSEKLIRFIFSPYHIRNDESVKWQAFKPRNGETSVTIKNNLSDKNLHSIGQKIESFRKKKDKISLFGEARIFAKTVYKNKLNILSAPSKNNPNHANIIDWPNDKDEYMMVCKELIIDAHYRKY